MELIYKIIGIVVFIVAISAILIPVTNELQSDEVNTIDVILIDGQSNGAYYPSNLERCDAAVVNQVLGAPEHKAFYYGTENGSSRAVSENSKIRSMYHAGQWVIGGEEPGLAYYLMEKNNRDVLVLNIARPATGIAELATGNAWTNGQGVIKAAIEEIKLQYDAINYVGWVMIHGEADREQSKDYYKQYFNILEDKLTIFGFKQCYIALPRYSWGLNAYDAMLEMAGDNPNIHIATRITSTFTIQNGLLNTDDLHYTQLGRLVLAEAVVDYIPSDPNYGDISISNLIQIIPVLMIVAAILMAVRLFRNKAE